MIRSFIVANEFSAPQEISKFLQYAISTGQHQAIIGEILQSIQATRIGGFVMEINDPQGQQQRSSH